MEENITEAAENIVEIAAIWREGTLQSRRGIFVGQFVIITCEPRRRDFAYIEEKARFCTNLNEKFTV